MRYKDKILQCIYHFQDEVGHIYNILPNSQACKVRSLLTHSMSISKPPLYMKLSEDLITCLINEDLMGNRLTCTNQKACCSQKQNRPI